MGYWAMDSFGNDEALDFLSDLEEQDDLALVSDAVSVVVVNQNEYLDAEDAVKALVAAEIVAAVLGRPGKSASQNDVLSDWLSRVKPVPNASLIANAKSAIQRVLAEDSELRELWSEGNQFEAWQADVLELLGRLNQ